MPMCPYTQAVIITDSLPIKKVFMAFGKAVFLSCWLRNNLIFLSVKQNMLKILVFLYGTGCWRAVRLLIPFWLLKRNYRSGSRVIKNMLLKTETISSSGNM